MQILKLLNTKNGGYCRFRHEFPRLCSTHTSLSGQLRHVKRTGSPQHTLGQSTGALTTFHFSSASSHRVLSLVPVELLPYLYIGDAGHSSRKELLQDFKITAILNVSTSCENHFPSDFRYKVIPVEDSNNANLLEWFQDAILFIENERRSGGKVLVHCHGGISRSATVCLAYLMYSRHLHLDDAYTYVKSRRHVISPNANFMMQLTQFETELRKLGFSWPGSAALHLPLSPCRHASFGSCPDISKFRVTEEVEDGGGEDMVQEEDDAGSKEGREEEEDDESSASSEITPLVFEHVSVGFFNKPLASPS
ncbi:dual specificity protein phosphatase 1-A-like [Physella acuta]|uniref:dual specificity protein phosphatase 1-A-like n=1 Tax=Physella acuta TaxID=109671 RepID=UPI0027DD5972|nr:dual specificity protein phosphatase 1-A-like [Physella acuta]